MSALATRLGMAAAPRHSVPWNTYAASLGLHAWWKLDEFSTPPAANNVGADASGNGRTPAYTGDLLPTRRQAPLVDGSLYSVTSGAVSNLRNNTQLLDTLTADSFTFGAFFDTTVTAIGLLVSSAGAYNGMAVYVNYALADTNVSGRISFFYDTGGTNVNGLEAQTTWNDGNRHALMFEYDEATDRIAIWFAGVKVADRARAGTRPTFASNNTFDWLMKGGSQALAGVGCDEYIFATRVLTAAEHKTIESYAAAA